MPLRTFVTGGAEAVQIAAAAAVANASSPSIFSPLTPSPALSSVSLTSPLPPLPGSAGANRPQVLTVHPATGKSWLDSSQPIAATNSPDSGLSVASSLASTSSGGSQSARGSRTDNLKQYEDPPLRSIPTAITTTTATATATAAASKQSHNFGPLQPPLDRKSSPLVTASAASPVPAVGSASPVPKLPLSSIDQSAGSGGLPVLALDENAPAGALLRFRRRSSGPDTPNPEYRILHRTRDSTIEVPANTKPTATSGSGGSRPNSQPPSPSKARRTSGGPAATSALLASAFAGINSTSSGGSVPASGGSGSPILMPAAVGITAMAGGVNPPNTNNSGSSQPLPFNAGPVPGLITVPVHTPAVSETGASITTAVAGDKISLRALSGKHGRSGPGGIGSGGSDQLPAWSYTASDRDHLPPAVTPGFSLRQTIALILASKSGEVCVVDDSDQRRPIVTVSATRLLKLLCPPLPAAAIASMQSPQPHTTPSRRGASPHRADLAPPLEL